MEAKVKFSITLDADEVLGIYEDLEKQVHVGNDATMNLKSILKMYLTDEAIVSDATPTPTSGSPIGSGNGKH